MVQGFPDHFRRNIRCGLTAGRMVLGTKPNAFGSLLGRHTRSRRWLSDQTVYHRILSYYSFESRFFHPLYKGWENSTAGGAFFTANNSFFVNFLFPQWLVSIPESARLTQTINLPRSHLHLGTRYYMTLHNLMQAGDIEMTVECVESGRLHQASWGCYIHSGSASPANHINID